MSRVSQKAVGNSLSIRSSRSVSPADSRRRGGEIPGFELRPGRPDPVVIIMASLWGSCVCRKVSLCPDTQKIASAEIDSDSLTQRKAFLLGPAQEPYFPSAVKVRVLPAQNINRSINQSNQSINQSSYQSLKCSLYRTFGADSLIEVLIVQCKYLDSEMFSSFQQLK